LFKNTNYEAPSLLPLLVVFSFLCRNILGSFLNNFSCFLKVIKRVLCLYKGDKIRLILKHFNFYIECNVAYKYDEDLNDKLSKSQNISGVTARTLKKKTRKETNLFFFQNYGSSSTFIWQRNGH
jgi:hypothetical protein